MSYLFPRRVLRAEDVLDPIELTLDISPAAERLSGRLNAHNFSETIASTVPVEEDAFYKTYYARVACDPQFGALGVFIAPSFPGDPGADPNAYRVTNTFEWQTIDNSSGQPLSVSATTGGSVLWVNAYAQYIWRTQKILHDASSVGTVELLLDLIASSPCAVQFAIRVDGSVLPETITGVDLADFRSSLPLKAATPRTKDTLLPGPQDIRGNSASSLGPPALPVRITTCIPVQAGNHTVELVVRRLPLAQQTELIDVFLEVAARYVSASEEEIEEYLSRLDNYAADDFVAVFNRQLAVTDLKSFPVDSVTAESVSAPGWDEEELISQASTYTNRVQPIIDGYNEVKAGNVQRGAFMHYHLPSALHGADTAERSFPAIEVFNNFYPGFTSATVTSTRFSGAPGAGWCLLTTGAPIFDVQTTQTVDVGTKGGLVLVLANTQLARLQGPEFAPAWANHFAAFRIMYKLVGDPTWYAIEESTGYVNSFVTFVPARDVRAEIALMGIIDSQDLPDDAVIDRIGLFGAAITSPAAVASTPPYVQYEIRRGNIIALHMRS